MNFLEKEMQFLGFNKLQEKENLIYFEKMFDDKQVFAIFDKKKEKLTSLDTYEIDNEKMKLVQNNLFFENKLKNLLSNF